MHGAGVGSGPPVWIEPEKACDLPLGSAAVGARAALEAALGHVDVVVQPQSGRRRRLLAADMDSTMITVECIDELADFAGLRGPVAAVTEAAMRGEIEFEEALDRRVALLRDLGAETIDQCRRERVEIMPGARLLVRTMRAQGAHCLLVSGGFTGFAGPVGQEIGFHEVVANRLEVQEGRLTGTVHRPIVGADGKLRAMQEAAQRIGVDRDAILAVGDGANDIRMLEAAGLGIAYRAKPVVDAAADARIRWNDLTALLYVQGYARADWVRD